MTLKQQQADDVAVFLNADDFAESCTYLPTAGGARTVSANCEEDSQDTEQQQGLRRILTLSVLVSRDSTTGIDDPKLYDGLRREGGAAEEVYSFTGEKHELSANTWVLIFEREIWVERGANRMPR